MIDRRAGEIPRARIGPAHPLLWMLLAVELSAGSCRKDAPTPPALSDRAREPTGEPAPAPRAETSPPRDRIRTPGPGSTRNEKPARKAAPPPRGARPDEALNEPSVALYLAERLDRLDQILTFRVHAEPGDYYNCYYKDRKASYHHVRLRGDGSGYLDGYVPRDPAGEALYAKLVQRGSLRLTVKVIMRPETVNRICFGQVEVLDHNLGWDFGVGQVAAPGALGRRLANARDRTPARNRPSIETLLRSRKQHVVGRSLDLRVRGRLGRYYQCRYRDTERTHYALELQGDGYESLRAFVARDEVGISLARKLAVDEGARLTVTVTVPEGRYDEVCPDQVEVIGWSPGWD